MSIVKSLLAHLKKYTLNASRKLRILVALLLVIYTLVALAVISSISMFSIIGTGPVLVVIILGYIALFFNIWMLGKEEEEQKDEPKKQKIGF